MTKCKKCRFYLSCILACFSEKGCERFEERELNNTRLEERGTDVDEINMGDLQ